MLLKLYKEIIKKNQETEGTLVKILKMRLTGIEVLVFEARLRGETFEKIRKSVNVDSSSMRRVDEVVKMKIRDYKKETKRILSMSLGEKNRVDLMMLLWYLNRYEIMTIKERKDYFGKPEIDQEGRKMMRSFLRSLLVMP